MDQTNQLSFRSVALKPLLLLIIWICMLPSGKAQNLVPNPSFEIFTTCPLTLGIGGPLQCTPWVAINSADYFNVCGGFNTGVPNNAWGFQEARTGVAYAGVFHKINGGFPEQREYIQAPLLEPLEEDVCYEVGYWVNLADDDCPVNRRGVLFSVGPEPSPFMMIPQVDVSDTFYRDQVNWEYVSGFFLAAGGEDHITIGNFYNDADTDFEPQCDAFVVGAYYYIEDVLVEESAIQQLVIDLGPDAVACDSFVIDPGNPEYTYMWSDGSSGPTLTVYTSGTYSVTVSYACFMTDDEIEVTIPPAAMVEIGPPTIDLCAGESYDIALDPTLEVYTWQDGSTGPDYSITTGGTYSVTLDNGCSTASDAIIVNQLFAPPPFTLGADTYLCEGATIVYDFDPSLGNFIWQDGSTEPGYTINTGGIYALTISNACGEQSAAIEITLLEPPSIDLGPDTAGLCEGDFIEYFLDPDIPDYLWEDGTTGPDYIISNGGLYSVTATNVCGMDSDTIMVTQIDVPEANLGPDLNLCPGDSIVLDLSGIDGNLIWQDGSTSSQYTIMTQGIYSVTISNACGSKADTILVTSTSLLTQPDLGPDVSLCSNQSFTLQPNAQGGAYLWSDMSTADTLLVTSPGTYYVEVSNACNALSDTIIVSINNNPPVVQLPADFALCAGDTVILDAGVVGVGYAWSDGSMLQQLSVTAPGVYAITISNTCGSSADTVVISSGVASPSVQLGIDTSICAGDTIVIQPVYANVDTWLWQDGSTGSQLTVTNAGTINVAVTNSCATEYDTIVVAFLPPIPILDLGPDTSICPGASLSLSIGIPDVIILWSNGSSDTSIVILDSTEVFAIISNQCGQSIDSLSVLLLPETPILNLGPDQNICPGEIFILTPDIPDVTYLWHDGSTLPSFETMQGDTISLTITGVCDTSSDTLILTESTQGPQVNLGPDILACDGETITIESGISGVQYLWQNGSTLDQFVTTQSGIYSISVSNACGNDQDTIEVLFEINPPAQNLGPDSILCDGEELILTATSVAGLSFLWQDGSTDETYSVTSPGGLYVLTGSNRCGEQTDSVRISFINGPPPVDLGPDTTLCEGNSLLVSVSQGAYDIIWQDGNTIPEFIISQTGVYSIQLSNACGFETDSIRVLVDTNVIRLNLAPQILWCPGDNFILDATQPFEATYLWSNGSVNPSIAVSAPGQYLVEVNSYCGQGTSQTDIIPQDVCSPSPVFYLPNVYAPDGNGVNDKFTLFTNLPENILGIYGEIFDRWGNLVFASSVIPFEWEGTSNGEPMNPGVYVYMLRVTYLDNGETQIKNFSGDVTLVR